MSNLIIVGTSDSPLIEDCCSKLEVSATGERQFLNTNKIFHERGIIQVSQGIEEISRLRLQFPEIKIIAVGAESVEEQIKALRLGAVGACLETSSNDEIELAIQAAIHESLLITPFRSILVLPFVHRQKKLSRITDSLGAKLLKEWRMQGHSALPPIEGFVQNLLGEGEENLADKLIAELDKLIEGKKINFITSKTKADTCLQRCQGELEAWMIGSDQDIGRKSAVIERIGAEIAQKRQTTLAHLPTQIPWEEVGPFCLYNWMRNIVPFLRTEALKQEQRQKAVLLEEMESLKALKVLGNKLKSKPDSYDLLEGALNVLRVLYSAQIKGKIAGGHEQIAFDLIDLSQKYLSTLSKSEELIAQTEQTYLVKSNRFKWKDILCSDWDSKELRRKYETQTGVSIHNLASMAKIDQEKFKKDINGLTYPFAFEAYINICLKHF